MDPEVNYKNMIAYWDAISKGNWNNYTFYIVFILYIGIVAIGTLIQMTKIGNWNLVNDFKELNP